MQVGVRRAGSRARSPAARAGRRCSRTSSASSSAPRPDRHAEPGPERPQARSGRSRARNSGEEEHVRQAEPGGARRRGRRTRPTSVVNDVRVVLGDRRSSGPARPSRRRPTGSRAPRARPTRAPRRAGGRAARRARDRRELGEVREDRQRRAAEKTTSRATSTPTRRRRSCARPLPRPAARARPGEHRRHQRRSATISDARPDRAATSEVRRDLVPRDERRDERSVRRQLGPPGADGLEGVPKACLRRLLVEREVDVGDDERLDRRRELLKLAQRSRRAGCESGNSSSFTNSSASSPITTTSRGCTIRSSRASQARHVSSSAPANLTQFVPNTSPGRRAAARATA